MFLLLISGVVLDMMGILLINKNTFFFLISLYLMKLQSLLHIPQWQKNVFEILLKICINWN